METSLNGRNGHHKYPKQQRSSSDVISSSRSDLLSRIERLIDVTNAEQSSVQVEAILLETLVSLDAVLSERLTRIDDSVLEIRDMLSENAQQKEWYGIAEAAEVLGRKPFTVREWCRLGRVNGHKRPGGRGNKPEWIISHDEIIRIRDKGLLPLDL